MSGREPVCRIFLSSTAKDLKQHRERIADIVLRLGDAPVGMEAFGAKPQDPVSICQHYVHQCDAVIVVSAHWYGWVSNDAQNLLTEFREKLIAAVMR